MICMENESGFEMLANAIVKQAADDYRKAHKMLLKDPKNPTARKWIREVEEFLRSQWFDALTDVDGEYILQKLKEEVRTYMPRPVKKSEGKKKKPAGKRKKKQKNRRDPPETG